MSPNRILEDLSQADFALLEPHLREVNLPLHMQLERRKKPVERVFFIERGLAATVGDADQPIGLGLIGREGMTGLSAVMMADRPLYDTSMLIAGTGHCMSADKLRGIIAASSSLHHALLRYAFSFLMQVTATGHANGRRTIEQRLARWLILMDARIDDSEIRITHEVLGTMIGVQRPGVTVALQALVRAGFIAHRRGAITIVNREALRKHANGAGRT